MLNDLIIVIGFVEIQIFIIKYVAKQFNVIHPKYQYMYLESINDRRIRIEKLKSKDTWNNVVLEIFNFKNTSGTFLKTYYNLSTPPVYVLNYYFYTQHSIIFQDAYPSVICL